jgi:predicted transcriptional regulator
MVKVLVTFRDKRTVQALDEIAEQIDSDRSAVIEAITETCVANEEVLTDLFGPLEDEEGSDDDASDDDEKVLTDDDKLDGTPKSAAASDDE